MGSNIENLELEIKKLHPLERKVLPFLNEKFFSRIVHKSELQEVEVMRAIQWLSSKDYLEYKKIETKEIVLDSLGKKYLEEGLPEIRLLKVLKKDYMSLDEIKILTNLDNQEINFSIGLLKKKGLIYITKNNETGELMLSKSELADVFLNSYTNPLKIFKNPKDIKELGKDKLLIYKEFIKRKNILKEIIIKDFVIELKDKGEEILNYIVKNNVDLDLIENVNEEVIKKELWKTKEFRYYDVNQRVPLPENLGRKHPIYESNDILSNIFIEMGFKEMKGPMVESAFWNMDVMWIPQDHPARDEQDTFYLDGEADLPEDLVEKYREMHEKGVIRSHTLEGEWSEEIAKKRLLRTHSTATTFRVLRELGERYKKGEDINGKYFYVANVFRNEAIDATHLAEFFQAEGFIIGDDLSLADLMGFVKEYYSKLGIKTIRFKPTFNPYTEPSMEAHYYDPVLKKWYALINSGIFRPETLKPLGLENKKIIAWGMGANRVAALLSKAKNMRVMTGADCDFEWIKNREIMTRNITR